VHAILFAAGSAQLAAAGLAALMLARSPGAAPQLEP
jgi:hypothetical protein